MSNPGPLSRRHRLQRVFHVVVVLAALGAVVSLAIERGFHNPERWCSIGTLHAIQAVAVSLFVLWRIVTLILAADRRAYLKQYWLDFTLMFIGGVVIVAATETLLMAGTIYIATIQVFLAVQLLVEAVRFHVAFSASRLPPARLFVVAFVSLILVGTLLLMLPKATTFDNVYGRGPFKHALNSLFTATSATCVTGLIVYDTPRDFTLFGQTVILALIQLGGLGIMIFGSVAGLLLGRQMSIRETVLMQDVLAHQTLGEIGRIVKFIIAFTFVAEAAGAVAMYSMWSGDPSVQHPWFHAVFHAVSAFCNAGFALQNDSLMSLRGAWQVYVVMMPLIVLGGLGFPVLYELAGRLWRRIRPISRRRRLSLHTRIALATSLTLIVLGAAVLWLGEWTAHAGDGQMATMSAGPRFLAAMFQSISARTAGFNTVSLDPGHLSPGSHFLLCLLMFVGGSPGSTAGGVKTITVTVMALAIVATLRRRENVECFARTIPAKLVRRAAAIIMLSFALVSVAALVLCYSESAGLQDVLFESVSAFGTVGLSTGLTPHLTSFGRVVIIVLMFVGRVGPLTMLLALAGRERVVQYDYPTEAVIMG